MRAIQKWSYISNLSRFDRDMIKNTFEHDDKFLKTRVIDLIMTSNLNLIITSGLNLIRPYVPTTYHSHLTWGGPSKVLVHVLLMDTYLLISSLLKGLLHVGGYIMIVVYYEYLCIKYISHLTT